MLTLAYNAKSHIVLFRLIQYNSCMKTEHYIRLAEAARILGKSRATVYRFIQEAKLVPLYKPSFPRTLYFKESEVRQLLIPGKREDAWNNKLLKAATRRDHGSCALCGGTWRAAAHHVVPLDQGGADTLENLITLCKGCHKSIHNSGWSALKKAKRHGTLSIALWLREQMGFTV